MKVKVKATYSSNICYSFVYFRPIRENFALSLGILKESNRRAFLIRGSVQSCRGVINHSSVMEFKDKRFKQS